MKETDIYIQKINTVKQNDAGFDQDRYMDWINYIDKRRGALENDPEQWIDWDMYFNIPNQEIRVFVSWDYSWVWLPLRGAATVYTRGDYVDNAWISYRAIRDFTSWWVFTATNWVSVSRVSLWKPAA